MNLTKKRRRILATVAALQDTCGYAPTSYTPRKILHELYDMGLVRRELRPDDGGGMFFWFITYAGQEALR